MFAEILIIADQNSSGSFTYAAALQFYLIKL